MGGKGEVRWGGGGHRAPRSESCKVLRLGAKSLRRRERSTQQKWLQVQRHRAVVRLLATLARLSFFFATIASRFFQLMIGCMLTTCSNVTPPEAENSLKWNFESWNV